MAKEPKRFGLGRLLSPVIMTTAVIIGGTATLGLASSEGKTRTTVGIAANANLLIARQIAERSKPIADRGRALARLSRQPLTRQLLEPANKTDRATADLRWLLRRDIRELKILGSELATVRRGAALLATNQHVGSDAPILGNPLAGSSGASFAVTSFGLRILDRLSVTSRGVDLATEPGDRVVSPVGGTIVFVGKLGRHDGLIVEALGHWIVLSGLVIDSQQTQLLVVGKAIERGGAIGTTAGHVVHLEVRVVTVAGGIPVQPVFETQ